MPVSEMQFDNLTVGRSVEFKIATYTPDGLQEYTVRGKILSVGQFYMCLQEETAVHTIRISNEAEPPDMELLEEST